MLIILLGCLLALLTAVSYFEKRMAWPYGHLEPQPQFNAISGYSSRWVEEARQAGFSFLGWAPDTKGPRYRVSYAMMVSPERDCFVIIGAGTLGNISVQGTWMYSPGTADRMFSSTDNQMCVEIDVLRCWRGQLVSANTFADLLLAHREMLHRQNVTPCLFSQGREVEDFKKLREEHFQAMCRSGWIKMTDISALRWHYTLKGALKWVFLNYSIGMLRALTFRRFPRLA